MSTIALAAGLALTAFGTYRLRRSRRILDEALEVYILAIKEYFEIEQTLADHRSYVEEFSA